MDITASGTESAAICIKCNGNFFCGSSCRPIGIPFYFLLRRHGVVLVSPVGLYGLSIRQCVRFHQPACKYITGSCRYRYGLAAVYNIVSIHINGHFDRLSIGILVMCLLIEWVVFISIIQVTVLVDDVGIFIPVIQSVFIDVSQILFIIVIVFIGAFCVCLLGNAVVYRVSVFIQYRVEGVLEFTIF